MRLLLLSLLSFLRYNISTGEYDGWNSSINSNISRLTNQRVYDPNTNSGTRSVAISELDVYTQFGMNFTTAKNVTSYILTQYVISSFLCTAWVCLPSEPYC